MRDLILIGNGFSLLVAAHELAGKGFNITIFNDSKKPGGHFAGIEIQGHKFDFGMVMFEGLDSFENRQDLKTYNPKIRNDWVRFGGAVSEWIHEKIEVTRAPTPQCLIDGKIYPDYLIANRLNAFQDQVCTSELFDLSIGADCHPRMKSQLNAYDSLNYGEAACFCHGKELHNHFIEPFVKKLLMAPSTAILARYHRAVWAPLYYPETISKVLRGEDVNLQEYKFWVSKDGFSGQLVSNIYEKLKTFKNVRLVDDRVDFMECSEGCWAVSAAGIKVESAKVVMGTSLERAHELIGLEFNHEVDSATVAVLFVIVKSSAIKRRHGCLMVVDGTYASYRLTDQDEISGNRSEWHRVTIEANPAYIEHIYGSEDSERIMCEELKMLLGIEDDNSVRVLKILIAKNSLVNPSYHSVELINKSSANLISKNPSLIFTSGLLGFGVSSLNDQVVQGLKISQELQ